MARVPRQRAPESEIYSTGGDGHTLLVDAARVVVGAGLANGNVSLANWHLSDSYWHQLAPADPFIQKH
jgi:hypothetical protein